MGGGRGRGGEGGREGGREGGGGGGGCGEREREGRRRGDAGAMGVPTFYRYVHDRWPRCISDFSERPDEAHCWHERPNPNGDEFDALYLDFNGIVHNATHPQDQPAPCGRQAMMAEVFRLVDRVVAAARPRKLLYIAVDGVAPRAKMDQQRSRRFLAAVERRGGALKRLGVDVDESHDTEPDGGREADEETKKLAGEQGDGADRGAFDYNAITPGSAFMVELAACMRYYCAARTASCPAWKHLCVLLSDSTVAGEGEHKIMDFIRQQRLQPGYDADSRHCVYGLDADLLMLALATHELRFHILREWVPVGAERFRVTCDMCGHTGHMREQCAVYRASQAFGTYRNDEDGNSAAAFPDKRLEQLDVSLAREYLLHALRPQAFLPAHPSSTPSDTAGRVPGTRNSASMPTGPLVATSPRSAHPHASTQAQWWDAERILDDFVFLTFLVGNDFLPPLPHLAIRSGGLDAVLDVYRGSRATLGGFLLSDGKLQLRPLARFLAALAAREESTILQHEALRTHKTAYRKRKASFRSQGALEDLDTYELPNVDSSEPTSTLNAEEELDAEEGPDASRPASPAAVSARHTRAAVTGRWRSNEYAARFGNNFHRSKLKRLCLAHIRGLAWCAHYYYHGCADWRWNFAHHYAPYAADLANVAAHLADDADEGGKSAEDVLGRWGDEAPLRPLQQLAAVLPPDSASLLPESYRPLICSEESDLAVYFPAHVPLDARGCKHAWQAIPLLPFLPLEKLISELSRLPLQRAEQRRDAVGKVRVYAHAELAQRICPELSTMEFRKTPGTQHIDAQTSWTKLNMHAPFAGSVRLNAGVQGGGIKPPIGLKLPAVPSESFACLQLRAPRRRPHSCNLLSNATPLSARLTLSELSMATPSKSSETAIAAKILKRNKRTVTAAEEALARKGTAPPVATQPVQPGGMFGFSF